MKVYDLDNDKEWIFSHDNQLLALACVWSELNNRKTQFSGNPELIVEMIEKRVIVGAYGIHLGGLSCSTPC